MKKQYKVISFILVLSLLFSSLVFTVGAEDSRSVEDITQNDFYRPTASFTAATSGTRDAVLKVAFGGATVRSAADILGDKCLETYLVEGTEENNTNSYVMLIPTAEAEATGGINAGVKSYDANGKPVGYHSQINVGTNTSLEKRSE